jgi:toxin ParE1/3/4
LKIKWTPAAEKDLDIIYDYISAENPRAAVGVVLHIMQSVEDFLPDNNAMGKPGRIFGTRELVIAKYPYVVPYRIRDDRIEVIRVIHTSMQYPDDFDED